MIKQVKLKDVASHSKGKQINGDDLIENGTYDYLNGGINPSGKWNEYNTESDTVTISEGGNSSGYVNFMINPFWCGAHCYYLYDLKTIPKYLYYALKSQEKRLMSLRTGAAMPNIKKSTLSEFTFQIDDNPNSQNQIVKILDSVSNTILKKNQQLIEYDQLIKSRFVELFGDVLVNDRSWPVHKWNDVLMIKNGKNQKKVEEKNGKYPICGSGGVMSYANDYICNENSVIIGRKGNINNPILMREKYWNVDTAFGLEPHISRINVDYLYMFCTFYDFLKHNKTVTIPSLTKSDLLKIDMPIPPIRMQTDFSEFVHQVDKLKFEVQKSLNETQMLFDSLMQEYFG